MKTLIISDIHANLIALHAVLGNVSCDRVICLGDIVGYGSQPSECVDLIFSKCDFVVCGNHDENVMRMREKQTGVSYMATQGVLWNLWTAGELSEKQAVLLQKNKKQVELSEGGLRLIFTHNLHENQYIYADSPDHVFTDFAEKHPADIVFFGHSHEAFKRRVDNCLFVNAGSVGQPRHGKAEASCAVLEDGQVEIINVQYDTVQVVKSLQKLPLHNEYLSLWNEFSHQAIVDQKQLSEVEDKIYIEKQKRSGAQNVSW